jgi:hypothetical protein
MLAVKKDAPRCPNCGSPLIVADLLDPQDSPLVLIVLTLFLGLVWAMGLWQAWRVAVLVGAIGPLASGFATLLLSCQYIGSRVYRVCPRPWGDITNATGIEACMEVRIAVWPWHADHWRGDLRDARPRFGPTGHGREHSACACSHFDEHRARATYPMLGGS